MDKKSIEKLANDILSNNKPEDITPEDVWGLIQNLLAKPEEKEEIEQNTRKSEQKAQKSEQKPKKAEQKGKSVKKSQKPKKDEKLWQFKCYSSLLKKLVKRVMPLSNEMKLNITKDGISTITVDPAHVCMVTLEIPRKDFYIGNSCVNKEVAYGVKEDFEIGIDLDKLDKTLKLFTQFDYVTGYVQNNSLYLDSDKIHKKIKLIDTFGLPDAKMPKLEFDVDAEISCDDIALLMRACDNSEYLAFIADKTGLYVVIEEDEDDLRIDLSKEILGKGKALYSSDYLKGIVNGLSQWNKLQLQYSSDSPMKLSGDVYDSGSFNYLLAPRIESE